MTAAQKNTVSPRRLAALVACGLVLLAIGVAWRIFATGQITQWQATKLSDDALARAAADPRAPAPYVMEWAKRLEAAGRSREAERVYSRAAETAPANAEAWVGFGRTAFVAGDWGRADTLLAKTVQQFPESANAHFTYASVLASTFRVRKAIEQLRLGLKIEPARGEAYETLGDLEMREGDAAAAADAYATAVKLLPKARGLRSRYGSALVGAGRYGPGQKELEAALAEDPSDVNARFSHGKALANSGKDTDRAQALLELNRVVAFSTNKSRAYVEAARIWLADGDRGNAIQALEHAFDLNPYNYEMLEMLSAAYKAEGRPGDASRVLKALDHSHALTDERLAVLSKIEADADLVNNLLLLARVDLKGSNVIEARTAIEAAIRLDPTNADAQRALKQIAAKPAG
jgi:tetratricopeptide (TPR) repeat protein